MRELIGGLQKQCLGSFRRAEAAIPIWVQNYSGYPVPSNEIERLKALHSIGLAGANSVPALDRICRMARELFDVPLAAITLLDREDQWLVAKCGTTLTKTAREHAFCSYTILHDEVLSIEDATRSSQFASNPYVTGEPNIRFYAGAPLVVGPDLRIGSLCVIDTKARAISAAQTRLLSGLARTVVDELWIQALARTGVIAADPPRLPRQWSSLDFDWRPMITSAQVRAARGLLGWSARELASAAGVSPMTVKRLEASGEVLAVREESVRMIQAALERAGAVFVFAPGNKPGVSPA